MLPNLRSSRLLASNVRAARLARRAYWAVARFSIPAPRVVFVPLLEIFLGLRSVYYFLVRVFVCEPFFKAYCAQYGKNVHTGTFIHWIQGGGRIVVGDNVLVDGKSTFTFASRFSDSPTLTIGSGTGIGHNCSFVVGRSITIGNDCRIAENVSMFDSSGHSSSPESRMAGQPPTHDSVKPIVIERNVWIGRGAVIFPGVTVGENSVISAHSVVVSSVPPNSLVLGNPARRMATV